jgi:general secretion pathway protein D
MNRRWVSRRHRRAGINKGTKMKSGLSCALAFLILPALVSAADETPTIGVSTVKTIEVNELIGRVAKRTGRQFVVDPRVHADVPLTGFDVDRVDYGRLLAILNVNQFAAFESGGVVRVTPDANARQFPLDVDSEVPAKALDDEFVTVMVQTRNICSAHAVPVLRPLMPQYAHLAAFPQTNMLIIMDRAANARRIVDMIGRLDKTARTSQACPEFMTGKPDGKPDK